MKKRFFLLLMGLVVVLGVGYIWLRPSPQAQLLTGIVSHDINSVRAALERGANPTLPIGDNNKHNITPGYTPLLVALSHGFPPKYLDELVQKGDVNAHSTTGILIYDVGLKGTPLHFAAHGRASLRSEASKQLELCQMLLKHGADVNASATEPKGWTPLMSASDPRIAELLLKAGADPNRIGYHGASVMNYVGKEPTQNPLWRLLKRYGGRPRKVSNSRHSIHRDYNGRNLDWKPESF